MYPIINKSNHKNLEGGGVLINIHDLDKTMHRAVPQIEHIPVLQAPVNLERESVVNRRDASFIKIMNIN